MNRLILQRKLWFSFVVGFFIIATACYAFKVGGLEFVDIYQDLSLRGAGLKKFLTIRVVAVGLYLPENAVSKDVLTDIPKSLEVIYLQNIPGSELQNATIKGIRLNVTPEEFESLEERIKQINAYYPSVQKKDRIRVTYRPGQGTTVEFNGVVQGVIEGEDFGQAFFAIWVGQKPVDERMKGILLGQKKQSVEEVNE